MSRITKNKKLMLEKYDFQKSYSLEEASKIIKITGSVFDINSRPFQPTVVGGLDKVVRSQ